MRNTNKSKFTPMYFVGVLICFTAFSGLLLSASRIYADNNTSGIANVSVTVPAICSLTVDPDEHAIDITPGNAATIGYSDIKAVCNDPSGLAVYAVGYTDDTYGNNNFIATINNNTYTIPSNSVSNPTTSQWNMTISALSGTYVPTIVTEFNNTPHTVPTLYTKVAYRNSATDIGDDAAGTNFRATFNVYVDHTQAAGTYTAKVKFLLVHPNVLTYNDQTGEPATSAPDTLARDPESIRYMQDVSTWGASVTAGQEIIATDRRDEKSYTVARLADGNLWMTQNLDLDIDATKTYTPADTDIPANWTPAYSTRPASDLPWRRFDGAPDSYDPGNLYWTGDLNLDWEDPANYLASSGDSHYHLGNYYNWPAAIAMNDISGYTESGTNADRSICPAGWTLPNVGDSSTNRSFAKLFASYGFTDNPISGDDAVWTAPLYFPISGWSGGTGGPAAVGMYAAYWAPVFEDYSEAWFASFYATGYLYASDHYASDYGNSIRCVAR